MNAPTGTHQFYPTPKRLARKMARLLGPRKMILEPSAGKGDLVNAYREEYLHTRAIFYGCEVSGDLSRELALKNVIMIGSDFLSANLSSRRFDGVLMNPPFSNAYKHIEKAISLMSDGGRLVAIVPTAHHKKDGAKLRELLESTCDSVIFDEVGNVFTDAERTTEIRCSIVTIDKRANSDKWDSFEDFKSNAKPAEPREEKTEQGLVSYSFIHDLVERYTASISAYKAVHDSTARMMQILPVSLETGTLSSPAPFNAFESELRAGCWQRIFNETQISTYMTSKMQQEFKEFTQGQARFEFTVDNIENLLTNLKSSINQIRERACSEMFELMTSYSYHNKWSGWKTNKCGEVGKKVILPCWSESRFSSGYTLNYRAFEEALNIEKALCLLRGMDRMALSHKWDRLMNDGELKRHDRKGVFPASSFSHVFNGNGYDKNTKIETEFFTVKLFKTGTAHLVFKDEKTRRDLNELVQRGSKSIGLD